MKRGASPPFRARSCVSLRADPRRREPKNSRVREFFVRTSKQILTGPCQPPRVFRRRPDGVRILAKAAGRAGRAVRELCRLSLELPCSVSWFDVFGLRRRLRRPRPSTVSIERDAPLSLAPTNLSPSLGQVGLPILSGHGHVAHGHARRHGLIKRGGGKRRDARPEGRIRRRAAVDRAALASDRALYGRASRHVRSWLLDRSSHHA